MKEFKWEALKKKAKQEFLAATDLYHSNMKKGNVMHLALLRHVGRSQLSAVQTAEALRDEGLKIIDSWDVRAVSRLVELFPAIVPKKLVGGPVECYKADTEAGDWIVAFQ